MDFNFPFLDVLVLPVGATSGERIELDGTNGEIRIYDSADRLRLRMASGNPSSIDFFTTQTGSFEGDIGASRINIGGENYNTMRVTSPDNTGRPGEFAEIRMMSGSDDGSEPPSIQLRPSATIDPFRLWIADDSSGTREQPMGTAVLVAGTVTVTHSFVTASSRIIIWRQVAGGTLGNLSVGAITAGTSFVINSDNAADTSTVGYLVVEPV